MKIATIVSTKGGPGKTTVTANLGAFCADANLNLGSVTANAVFQQARFQAAAHITACVQNMHGNADTVAHAVYFALGMNRRPDAESRYADKRFPRG